MKLVQGMWIALLDLVFGSTCVGCDVRGAGTACPACRSAAAAQPRIVGTVFVDRAPVSRLVRAAKFGRWRGGSAWFARRLVERLDPALQSRVVAIAWVPRSTARARSRGVDLPRDVARRVGNLLCVPSVDVLVRASRSRRQRGLDREERRANARSSFDLHHAANDRLRRLPGAPRSVRNPVVLLIDDVCTTGATIDACAALLTVACRRRFPDIHVHPIAMATVPVRESKQAGVPKARSLRGKCIHENR